jgi:hypothetical protein
MVGPGEVDEDLEEGVSGSLEGERLSFKCFLVWSAGFWGLALFCGGGAAQHGGAGEVDEDLEQEVRGLSLPGFEAFLAQLLIRECIAPVPQGSNELTTYCTVMHRYKNTKGITSHPTCALLLLLSCRLALSSPSMAPSLTS